MLVFTGGWSPGQPNAKPDGEVLIGYAKALGVPSKALRTTGLVVNTAEEAQAGAIRGGRRSYRGVVAVAVRRRGGSSAWRFL